MVKIPACFCLKQISVIWIINILIVVYLPQAQAEHKSLWEIGAGVGVVHAPLYRGAKQSKDYTLPIPFIRYRGKVFAADEDGMRGQLFNNGRLEVNLSFAASLPVSKDNEGPRMDMPSLDPTLQFGPAVNYLLSKSSTKTTRNVYSLKLPLRTVLSFGNPTVEHRGWAISPSLEWVYQSHSNGKSWRMSLSAGPLFANAKFHNYFYQVGPQYVTGQRARYSSHSGYSGSRVTVRFSHNSRQFFFGFFARFDTLNNAAFENSPLVETERYGLYGIAATWIISRSDEKAQHWKYQEKYDEPNK